MAFGTLQFGSIHKTSSSGQLKELSWIAASWPFRPISLDLLKEPGKSIPQHVTTSKALVTSSDALVSSSFLLLLVRHLLPVAMHFFLVASCYY